MTDLVKFLINPDAPKEAPTAAIRLARVIHWTSIAVAGCMAIFSFVIFIATAGEAVELLSLIPGAIPILLAGRAVRYVVAQE